MIVYPYTHYKVNFVFIPNDCLGCNTNVIPLLCGKVMWDLIPTGADPEHIQYKSAGTLLFMT